MLDGNNPRFPRTNLAPPPPTLDHGLTGTIVESGSPGTHYARVPRPAPHRPATIDDGRRGPRAQGEPGTAFSSPQRGAAPGELDRQDDIGHELVAYPADEQSPGASHQRGTDGDQQNSAEQLDAPAVATQPADPGQC